LKAKPSALFAVAFNMATISEALMKEKLPLKRSIPPQPARALGSCRLNGETLFWGLGEAGPDISERIIACRLALEGRWPSHIRGTASVVEEAVHLRGDVGPGHTDQGEMGRSNHRQTRRYLPVERGPPPKLWCLFHQ
jgi:hypothetical protein